MNKHEEQNSFPESISVVVPVFNSQDTLSALAERLQNILRQIGTDFELIMVNDGSEDQSWQVIRELCDKYDWIRSLDLLRNYGQHNALLCGIREAANSVVITLDDDLQNPPEEIPKLLAKLQEGYDVVYGTPQKEHHGLWRDLASQLSKLALKVTMGVDIAPKVSAFRAFRTKLRTGFASYQSPFVSIDVLLSWSTNKFSAIKVKHEQRQVGFSNYTFSKLVRHAFNMLTGFSTAPLQAASMLGFILTIFGIFVLIYVVGRWILEGAVVPGFAFLASLVTIFSGTQLFTLGIFGEYLSRIYFRTMDRPPYIICRQVGGQNGVEEKQ